MCPKSLHIESKDTLFKDVKFLYSFIVSPIFIINPTIGLIIGSMLLLKSQSKILILHSYVYFLAIWISLLNLTKSPAGDQLSYLYYFQKAGELSVMNWWDEMTAGSLKEPLFYLYTYFSYYIFGGEEKIYFFLFSFINYYILFKSIIKINEAMKTGFIYPFTGLIVIVFFTQYFTLTLHVIRQILAVSLVLYAIVLRGIDGRSRYILLICGILIHTSVTFLAILGSIPWFYTRMNIYKVLICLSVLVFFVILFGTIGEYLSANTNGQVATYAFSRMTDDADDGSGDISIRPMLMVMVPMVIISLKLLIIDLPNGRYANLYNRNLSSPLYVVTYLFLIMAIFILGMSGAPLIQYRFFMMIYTFIPLILPYLFSKSNILSRYYLATISLLFLIRFMILHNTGTFQYAQLSEVLCYNLFQYF